jgi:hypothetical protein
MRPTCSLRFLLDHVLLRVLLRCVSDGDVRGWRTVRTTSRNFAPSFAYALYLALTGCILLLVTTRCTSK